jgi:pyruvate/2-oxoglutarate dehydrogenase complex dihydrolipoamide dehydrogenase (E3) component
VLAGVSPDTLLSLAALGQRETLPPRLALIGGAQATAVEWAQGLRQHGIEVTLILDQDRFLPAEDPDLRRLISAQLAALGIPLLPRSQIDKIEPQDGVVHLWVGDRCFTVDALVAAGVGQPRVEAMGLDAMGIVHHPGGILVNARLQTSHPRVYAAGSVLGGEDRLALALPEVQVAVLNALFWPGRQMPYQHAAYGLETLPEVGRVGLTEPQARRLYGEDVQIFQGSAVPLSPTTAVDFCKLISQPNGRLLGAHLIGEGAIALAQMLAVGLKQGLTVDAIVKDRPLGAVVTQPAVSHTLAGVLHQAADQKRQQQWHIGAWRRDWAENWFNWRRSRS